MPEGTVSLELHGREAFVDAWSFKDALNAFLGLLLDVDISVTLAAGKPGHSLTWFVRSLHASSPTVEFVAESKFEDLDVSDKVIELVQDALATLEGRPIRPLALPYTALERCQELGQLMRKDSIAEIVVTSIPKQVRITERLETHVREVMGQKAESLGSVQGQLEMVTLRGRRYFNVYSLATGKATRCFYDASVFELVRQALGKMVAVKGTIRSFPHEEGKEIMDIKELVIVEEALLPTPDDIRGIAPGFTGGVASERYLKGRWSARRDT